MITAIDESDTAAGCTTLNDCAATAGGQPSLSIHWSRFSKARLPTSSRSTDSIVRRSRFDFLATLAVCTLVILQPCAAERFGIIGKSSSDPNFVLTFQGCEDVARLGGDECELIQNPGPANVHLQSEALREALQSGRFDALAVSVTSSREIEQVIQSATIPIITFDSPFKTSKDGKHRIYVGIDNFEFGRSLAKMAKRHAPHGGRICLMTAAHDPNLEQRVAGVRRELSNDPSYSTNEHLDGQGGWTEDPRCPWNTGDQIDRALLQTRIALANMDVDVLLSVGHWPAVQALRYRQTVQPFRDRLTRGDIYVVVGVGNIDPDMRRLLDDRLVHGYVGIDFHAMGQSSYQAMRDILDGATLPWIISTTTTSVAAN